MKSIFRFLILIILPFNGGVKISNNNKVGITNFLKRNKRQISLITFSGISLLILYRILKNKYKPNDNDKKDDFFVSDYSSLKENKEKSKIIEDNQNIAKDNQNNNINILYNNDDQIKIESIEDIKNNNNINNQIIDELIKENEVKKEVKKEDLFNEEYFFDNKNFNSLSEIKVILDKDNNILDYKNFIKYKEIEEGTVFRFVLNNLETEMEKEKFKDLKFYEADFSGIDELDKIIRVLNLYFLSNEDGVCRKDKFFEINMQGEESYQFKNLLTYEGECIKNVFFNDNIFNPGHNEKFFMALTNSYKNSFRKEYNISNAYNEKNFYYLEKEFNFKEYKVKAEVKSKDFFEKNIGIVKNYDKFRKQFKLILEKFTVLNLEGFEWIKSELEKIADDVENKDKIDKIDGSKNINIELKNKLIEGLEKIQQLRYSHFKENIYLEKYIELFKMSYYFSYLKICKIYFSEDLIKLKKIDDSIISFNENIRNYIFIKNQDKNGFLFKFLINTGYKKAKEVGKGFEMENFNLLKDINEKKCKISGSEKENNDPSRLENVNARFLKINGRKTFFCSDLHGDNTLFYTIISSDFKNGSNFIIAGDLSHRAYPKNSYSGICNVFVSALLNRYENEIKEKGLNIIVLRGNHETENISYSLAYSFPEEINISLSPFKSFKSEDEVAFSSVFPEILFLESKKGIRDYFIMTHGLAYKVDNIEYFENNNFFNENKKIINIKNIEKDDLLSNFYKKFFKKESKISHFAWSEFCADESNSYFDEGRGLKINHDKLDYLKNINNYDFCHGHQNNDFLALKSDDKEKIEVKCFCSDFDYLKKSCISFNHHKYHFLPVQPGNSYGKVHDINPYLLLHVIYEDGRVGKYLEDGFNLKGSKII